MFLRRGFPSSFVEQTKKSHQKRRSCAQFDSKELVEGLNSTSIWSLDPHPSQDAIVINQDSAP